MSAEEKKEVMEANVTWQGEVAVLTINNVARRNAISDPVKHDLSRHMNELSASKKCRDRKSTRLNSSHT